jgi:hypothetical protein
MTNTALTAEQRKMFDAIDHAIADAALAGATIDPAKVAAWKIRVLAGVSLDDLIKIIGDDKEKVLNVRPKPSCWDYPGMKHMGNGYYLSGNEPEDPPVD